MKRFIVGMPCIKPTIHTHHVRPVQSQCTGVHSICVAGTYPTVISTQQQLPVAEQRLSCHPVRAAAAHTSNSLVWRLCCCNTTVQSHTACSRGVHACDHKRSSRSRSIMSKCGCPCTLQGPLAWSTILYAYKTFYVCDKGTYCGLCTGRHTKATRSRRRW